MASVFLCARAAGDSLLCGLGVEGTVFFVFFFAFVLFFSC